MTGVQTCALPICGQSRLGSPNVESAECLVPVPCWALSVQVEQGSIAEGGRRFLVGYHDWVAAPPVAEFGAAQSPAGDGQPTTADATSGAASNSAAEAAHGGGGASHKCSKLEPLMQPGEKVFVCLLIARDVVGSLG